jgi:anti-sigma regulatory factor (Ser/Thr protein kinase)
MELRLTSALDDLAQAYSWLDEVASKAQISGSALNRMHVALEEAVANAAIHGFADREQGTIVVKFYDADDTVALEVDDDGLAFDPVNEPVATRATTLADVMPGGWGLGLIRKFCSSVSYERRAGRNHLTMRFRRDAR